MTAIAPTLSPSRKIRALDYRYREVGGMEGRYREMYLMGYSAEDIAAEFDMPVATLRNHITKWNRQRKAREATMQETAP